MRRCRCRHAPSANGINTCIQTNGDAERLADIIIKYAYARRRAVQRNMSGMNRNGLPLLLISEESAKHVRAARRRMHGERRYAEGCQPPGSKHAIAREQRAIYVDLETLVEGEAAGKAHVRYAKRVPYARAPRE